MTQQGSSDELSKALAAVDRLNSWVRSQSFGHQWRTGSLRRVIYHFKRQAILRASAELPCEHRKFVHEVECRDCRGSGRYEDQYGHIHNHCWACGNSGTAKLSFVESRIGERSGLLFPGALYLFTWHSPADKFPYELPLAEGGAGENWAVNQPGRDLDPEEAAGYLNTAHEVFRDTIPDHWTSDWNDQYRTEDSRYCLWIGEDEPFCRHCLASVDPNKTRCGKTFGRVAFSFFVCEACKTALSTDRQWDVTVPKQLWGHGFGKPNINAWIVRQNAFAEKPKHKGYAFA